MEVFEDGLKQHSQVMCTKAHAHPSHTHPTLNYQLLKFVDMPAKSVWSS